MKTSDINFFQRHVEKIVLGVMVLLSLAIVVFFVAGNPYTIEANGRSVAPDELEAQIAEVAQQLDQRLKQPSTLAEVQIPDYTQQFRERRQAAIAQELTMPVPLKWAGLDAELDVSSGDIPPYDLPRPPVPSEVAVRTGYGMLGDQENRQVEEQLVRLIGSRRPLDFQYVSVGGKFNMEEWEQRLKRNTENPVPELFWRAKLGIASVYLQRQKLDPATGEWGPVETVAPLPGSPDVLPTEQRDWSMSEAERVLQTIKAVQEQVARTPFPNLAQGGLWQAPTGESKQLTAEDYKELMSLQERIKNLESQVEAAQERLRRVQEREQSRPDPRRERPTRPGPSPRAGAGDPYGGGYGGDPYGGEGGRATRAPRATQREARQPQSQTEQLQEQIERLNQQRQEAVIKRDELLGIESDVLSGRSGRISQYPGVPGEGGYDPYGGEFGGYGGYGGDPYGGGYGGGYGDPYGGGFDPYSGRRADRRGDGQQQPPAQDTAEVTVWAHDLTVEPGATYRYRLVVAVINPLFRQHRVAEEQKQQFFDKLALGPDPEELASTPWTEPVTIDPRTTFFFVSGNAQSQNATVEVWKLYEGRWRSKEFDVQPGDPIGGEAEVDGTRIDMRVDAVVVDLTSETQSGSGRSSDTRMLYLEPGAPIIRGRSLSEDQDSQMRTRLQGEAAIAEQRLAATF